MRNRTRVVGLAGLLALGMFGGCHSDKPHEYGEQRPPVGDLDSRDRGLQSKDVVQASDQMAMDLLADPALNASKNRWVIVVDRVDNKTVNSRFDLDIFIQRLKVNLAKHGKGRVQLIENREKLRELQDRELDGAPTGKRIQPDYSMYARANELPNRGTSYYFIEFTLTDIQKGDLAWTNAYEVRVER